MDITLEKKIIKRISEITPSIIEIRNKIHQNPELSELESNTSKLIEDSLKDIGVPYISNVAGYGVLGLIEGNTKEPAIGIRADIDALPILELTDTPFKSKVPGVMHACGHDIHTAILLGTAKILWEFKSLINGTVKLFFQPAEETVGGAKPMIDAKVLENPKVKAVLGIHVNPNLPMGELEFSPGVIGATSTEFKITIKGKSCHGAHPEEGVDTIPIACQIVSSLQTIITRNLSPLEPNLITIGQIHGGTKNNIVSEETFFSGIIRSFDMKQKEFIKNKISNMSQNIAKAFGANAEVNFNDSYPIVKNDDEIFDIVTQESQRILGKDKVRITRKQSLGADDFSYFCQYSKGLYFDLGCHKENCSDFYPLHSNKFDPDVRCIENGIITEVFNSLKLLEVFKDE